MDVRSLLLMDMIVVRILQGQIQEVVTMVNGVIVGREAQALLNKEAEDAVQKLLPKYAEGDLASLCSWPDEIRFWYKYRWTGPLHYIDTPDFRCNYEYSRDCHNVQGEKTSVLQEPLTITLIRLQHMVTHPLMGNVCFFSWSHPDTRRYC
jgi:hypothetical protein